MHTRLEGKVYLVRPTAQQQSAAARRSSAESVHRRWSAQGESETRVDLQLEFRSNPPPVLSSAISVRVLL